MKIQTEGYKTYAALVGLLFVRLFHVWLLQKFGEPAVDSVEFGLIGMAGLGRYLASRSGRKANTKNGP